MSGDSTKTRTRNDPLVMLTILVGFSMWVLVLLLLPDRPVLITTALVVGGVLGIYVIYLVTIVLLIPVNVLIRLVQRRADQYTWVGLYLPFPHPTEIAPNHLRAAWESATRNTTTLKPLRGYRYGWLGSRKLPVFECEDPTGQRLVVLASSGGYFFKRATGLFHRTSTRPIHDNKQRGWHRTYRFDHDWQIATDPENSAPSYVADGTRVPLLACSACSVTMMYAWLDDSTQLSIYSVEAVEQLSRSTLRGLFVGRMSRHPCPSVEGLLSSG